MKTVTLTLDKLDIEGTITRINDNSIRVKFADQSYNIAYEHVTKLVRRGR